MKIVMTDGRIFQGTPLQIVRAMQEISFSARAAVPQYIESVIEDAQRFEGIALATTGTTDAELAASLIAELIRTGLAQRG